MPWQNEPGTSWTAHADDDVTEVTGRRVPFGGVAGSSANSATPAPIAWGPEVWPEAVRANMSVWPPVFRDRQLDAAIRRPLFGPRRIAIVSNKDGVGKSTTARMLQAIFQLVRGEECALVDAGVGSGRSTIVRPEKGEAGGIVENVSDNIFMPEAEADHAALISFLSDAFPLVICDVATALDGAATRRILDVCDQIIVVATPAVDGLYAASRCMDDLAAAGYGHLVDDAICAINRIRPMPFSDLLNIDRHFQRRCRAVVRVPWDSRATTANAQNLDELRSTTRAAFYELAAAVAQTFGVSPTTQISREEEEEENR